MTDWNDFTLALMATWPTQKWERETLTLYVSELEQRGVGSADALRALRKDRSQFPPSAAALQASVERELQGPPPSWMAAHASIARKVPVMLPYHEPQEGLEALVAALAEEHEAVARFVCDLGVRGVRVMPDPRAPQDAYGAAQVDRHERYYRRVVEAWAADPRRGFAVEEAAKRMALEGTGEDVIEADAGPFAQIAAQAESRLGS